MNKHFTKDYDIITDTENHIAANGGDKPWMGIVPHADMDVESITIEGRGQLTGSDADNYVADLPVGIPFLCQVTQIKLGGGGCKMIKPN
ncbi:MAG: hypothetical protein J5I47_01935 [Vicingus serpentipes]|nr:hypothetical protein [Vicingus serpentipes]